MAVTPARSWTNVEALQTVLSAAIDSEPTLCIHQLHGHFSALCGHPRDRGDEFDWWHEAPHYVKSRVLAERAVLEARYRGSRHCCAWRILTDLRIMAPRHTATHCGKHQTPNNRLGLQPTRWISAMQPTPVYLRNAWPVGGGNIVNELIHQRDFYAMAGSNSGIHRRKYSPCEKPMSLPRSPKSSIESKR